MTMEAGQMLKFSDSERRRIGDLTVERRENDLVFAHIEPGPDFTSVEPLFRAFEEAVELQARKRVDELDAEIAALKLHLTTADGSESVPIRDVQIWSDGEMSCRIAADAAGDDGFDPEVARTRQNEELMALLDARTKQTETLSLAEGRRQLGL